MITTSRYRTPFIRQRQRYIFANERSRERTLFDPRIIYNNSPLNETELQVQRRSYMLLWCVSSILYDWNTLENLTED